MGSKGVVAAGHERTARAAERILLEGGNAFDAILAAMCAACVCEPVLASLGGGGFLLAAPADGPARVYDFFAHTPRRRRPTEQLDLQPVDVDFGTARQLFHFGLGSVATPGVVRGLFEIHRNLGSVPMRDVVAPAVELARGGVEVNSFQAHLFKLIEPILLATPAARAVFGSPSDEARPPREGDHLHLPDLAVTLEQLAREGDDLFYRGEIARRIVERCRAGGGCLREDDLAGYRVARREPLSLDYRGARVRTNPPPACGGALIAFALELLQAAGGLSGVAFGSGRHLQLLAEVMALTNEARVEADAAEDGSGRGTSRLLDADLLERYRREILGRARSLRGTTHMNVIDGTGNVASLTLSNGEGCGDIVPGTGIMLNNMLGEEDLLPEAPDRWPPNHRISSMMSPTLLERPDGSIVATGSGGSKRIRTAILQVIVNLVDFGMSVEDAVTSPRLFLEGDRISIEPGFDPAPLGELVDAYPDHETWDRLDLFFGGAHTVERHGARLHGAGDVRRGGVCLVVG